MRATVWERVMGYGGSELDAGSVVLPEGEHAERAARRIVQHELQFASRVGWVCGGIAGILGVVLALTVAMAPDELLTAVAGLAVTFLAISLYLQHKDRRCKMFIEADVDEILRMYSVASLRSLNELDRRASWRAGSVVSVICCCGLALVVFGPSVQALGTLNVPKSMMQVLLKGAIMGMVFPVFVRSTLKNRGTDADIENHRRGVLGDDWFPG